MLIFAQGNLAQGGLGAFFVGMKVCLCLPFAEQAAFCVCSPSLTFFFPPSLFPPCDGIRLTRSIDVGASEGT